MGKSSNLSHWIEGFAGVEHGPEYGDTSAGECNEGLGMVLSLAPLSFVERPGERVADRDCAEGALVEHALESLVAAVGVPAIPD
jgi:hypothetical protein